MKIEKFYLFLLACFVAIGAYSQDGQQKMTGDEKYFNDAANQKRVSSKVMQKLRLPGRSLMRAVKEYLERMLLLKVIPPVELSQIWMVSLF